MIFTNNITFLGVLIFFLMYFLLFEIRWTSRFHLKSKARSHFISISSLIFYASWYPPAVLLLFYHAFLGVYGGRKIVSKANRGTLFVVIALCLLPLLFFKYFNYFFDYFDVGVGLILPLGLSFYTFSMIAYFVDIYKKEVYVNQSFIELLMFISFWPHLASGPILRAKNIFSNIFKEEKLTSYTISLAILLISVGVVKKLLIADNIGAYVNWNISYGIEGMTSIEAWATILGFSAQIYADFSGYSDMAIGFALLMGFKLHANFNYPYRATTITDFWRRWHISLSSWFRDYVYIPLGGSKNGIGRSYFNIMIVFLLSGIWHGVGLGFLIWGGIHGGLLVLEKMLGKGYLKIYAWIRWGVTSLLVVVAWAFFRLEYSDAMVLVKKMFSMSFSEFSMVSPYFSAVIFMMIFFPVVDHVFRFYKVDKNGYPELNRSVISIILLSVLVVLALTFSGSPLPFIYFEF